MTVTKIRRDAARLVLSKSREYDATTMQITRDGVVTAKKDADKTFNGPEDTRYSVAHIDEMVDANGNVREGF